MRSVEVSVWDAESGAKLQELLCDSWALSVAYVPGIKAVICGEEAHKLTVWDLESGSAKWDVELSGPVNVVSYLADAAAVVANNADTPSSARSSKHAAGRTRHWMMFRRRMWVCVSRES